MSVIDFKKRQDLLWFSEKQSTAWIEHSPVCTKIVDLEFHLQYMSSAGITGLRIDDITEYYGKPYPLEFYPQLFRDEMTKSLIKARDTTEIVIHEGSVVDIDGNVLWFHSTIVPINDHNDYNDQIDYFMVVSVDITEQKQVNIEIQELNHELEARVKSRTLELEKAVEELLIISETDSLTTIANRHAYERRLTENVATAKRNSESLSFLIIDVDCFKEYNDKYGHDFGDVVLTRIAQTIKSSLLRETDFAARFGGEEFVVLLPSTEGSAALTVAERIRKNVRLLDVKHDVLDAASAITVSIGVASLKTEALNKTDLFKQADIALYIAKKKGKNCCQIFTA
ncbi:sensor domain-containing diguanylate cyclase [Amphritea japonica]|uniref:diguanylate cyclase n=1 Tax=Amphritea japonica ATCC BAA-1530 TaxID=1278309 RepID=A0A7R6STX8_9GAMM|nr:sensor domain-containing diguanylate cyclase [Amphritea japonica]BBB27869.1 signal transduction protein [Amphritea japonica ATCC BAA-1530]